LWFSGLVASAIIAFTCNSLLHIWQRIVAGLIAPLLPLTFAVGQVLGWFALLIPRPALPSEVVLLNRSAGNGFKSFYEKFSKKRGDRAGIVVN